MSENYFRKVVVAMGQRHIPAFCWAKLMETVSKQRRGVKGVDAVAARIDGGVDMRFKCFTAIAITLVVAGHVSSVGLKGPFNLVEPYSYHVAAFLFSSGYFFRMPASGGVGTWLVRKARRLLVPMLGLYLVYGVLVSLLHGFGFTFGADLSLHALLVEPWTTGHQFLLNMPMWFIAPFLAAQVVYLLMCVTLAKTAAVFGRPAFEGWASLTVCLACGAVAMAWGGADGMGPGPAILMCRVLFFLPWLALGRLYRERLERHDVVGNAAYLFVCLLGELLVQTLYGRSGAYVPSWGTFPCGVAGTYLSTGLGIAFLLRVSRIMAPLVDEHGLTRRVSDGSFSIMCHHYLGFFVLRCLFAAVAATGVAFSGFDFAAWLSDASYVFYPRGMAVWAFAYVAFGIGFSLLLRHLWSVTKGHASFLRLAMQGGAWRSQGPNFLFSSTKMDRS